MATITPISKAAADTAGRLVHDGGDIAVVAQANINQSKNKWRWLAMSFVSLFCIAAIAATVDIAVMHGLLTAKYSDEFGIVDESNKVWIWLSSAVTVLYFFVIGRCFSGTWPYKIAAGGMYMALLSFIAVALHSTYQSDFMQIFGAFATGWGNVVASAAGVYPPWAKPTFMLVLSVVMTGPGLLFAWAERRVELKYCEMALNSCQLQESESIVSAYNEVKQASDALADQEEDRQKVHAYFSDPANAEAVAKDMQLETVKAYIDQLNEMLRAIPPHSLQTPRAEQAANEARRVELTNLISQASSLKFT